MMMKVVHLGEYKAEEVPIKVVSEDQCDMVVGDYQPHCVTGTKRLRSESQFLSPST